MAVMRVHKNSNYTVMSNYHFKEKEMSLKAKGLLSLMLSLPDDWDYSIMGLCKLSKDGKDSVMTALNELEKFGYLERTKVKDNKGKFNGYDYDIFEIPQDNKQPKSEKPKEGNPYAENPNTENPPQLNTKELNPKELKTKNKDILDKPQCGSIVENNSLTEELIKRNFMSSTDLDLYLYNDFFNQLTNEYDYIMICKVINYVIARMKDNKEIDNTFNYFKYSVLQNLEAQEYREELSTKDHWLNY